LNDHQRDIEDRGDGEGGSERGRRMAMVVAMMVIMVVVAMMVIMVVVTMMVIVVMLMRVMRRHAFDS
jgi:hypothetical protein